MKSKSSPALLACTEKSTACTSTIDQPPLTPCHTSDNGPDRQFRCDSDRSAHRLAAGKRNPSKWPPTDFGTVPWQSGQARQIKSLARTRFLHKWDLHTPPGGHSRSCLRNRTLTHASMSPRFGERRREFPAYRQPRPTMFNSTLNHLLLLLPTP